MKHSLLNVLAATAGVLMLLGLVCGPVSALEPLVEVGVGVGMYEENIDSDEPLWTLRGGVKEFPVYLVVTKQDEVGTRVLGQEVSSTDFTSLGLGVSHEWDQFSVYGELAYVDVDTKYWPATHEVAYTHLVGRHAVEGRNVPVSGAYTLEDYVSEYEQDDSTYSITVGVGWQVHEHVKVTLSHRFMEVDTYVAIYDQERRDNNRGWWEESDSFDYGMTSMSILYTY